MRVKEAYALQDNWMRCIDLTCGIFATTEAAMQYHVKWINDYARERAEGAEAFQAGDDDAPQDIDAWNRARDRWEPVKLVYDRNHVLIAPDALQAMPGQLDAILDMLAGMRDTIERRSIETQVTQAQETPTEEVPKYLNANDATSEWKLYAFQALWQYRLDQPPMPSPNAAQERQEAIRAIWMEKVATPCDECDTPETAAMIPVMVEEWIKEWDAAQIALDAFAEATGLHVDDATNAMRLICDAWGMTD